MVLAGLWREFGIPADRALGAEARWLRKLGLLEMARQGGGEE